jgi:hypothetical protein
MASVQTSLHTINAPYAGVIAGVMAEMGDMAMPGKPLFAVYEPTGYRLVVNVPQSKIAYLKHDAAISVLIPAAKENERSLMTTQLTIFPTADPISNMVMLRLTLPLKLTSVAPGKV